MQNFQSEVGVKQCCNLSFNLFNTFLFDLENIFSDNCDVIQLNNVEIRCLMYADDLLILSKSEVGLQNCLKNLNSYTKKWKINVNLDKTKIMVFNKNGRNIHANVTLGGKSVAITSKYCYLGVILTSSGSFQESQQDRYRKGLRALYCLKKEFFTENGANIKLFLKLTITIISPILCYYCEVWGAYLQTRNLSFHKFKENLFSIKLIAEKIIYKVV